MEEPGFPDTRNIFALTRGGDRVHGDRRAAAAASAMSWRARPSSSSRPSHQFPTTVTMPLERRMELLELATRRDFSSSRTTTSSRPTMSTSPARHSNRSMMRAGSSMSARCRRPCSRAAARLPGRPGTLIEEARALRRLMVRHAPNNNQRTAALFLSLGHHDTLIRRLHRTYRARWETMGAALHRHLPGCASIPSFGGTGRTPCPALRHHLATAHQTARACNTRAINLPRVIGLDGPVNTAPPDPLDRRPPVGRGLQPTPLRGRSRRRGASAHPAHPPSQRAPWRQPCSTTARAARAHPQRLPKKPHANSTIRELPELPSAPPRCKPASGPPTPGPGRNSHSVSTSPLA